MINLLPIENKKNVWRDYRVRRSIVAGLLVMFLLLTGIILLAAFYTSSLLGWQPRTSVGIDRDEKDRPSYELKLKDLRDNLALLSVEDSHFAAADIFEKIAQVKLSGITIEAFRYETKADGEEIFRLQIGASTRKVATEYINRLHKVPGVKDIVSPILTGDKNLSVPLEILLIDQKK